MIYGIASYKRPDCITVNFLLKNGIPENDIIISVQNAQDYKDYKANFPNIKIIYNENNCASGNRNNILKYVKERPICLLDDDIRSFAYYSKEGKFITDNKKAFELIEEIIEESKKNDYSIIGIAANSNGIIARNRSKVDVDVLLQGSFLIVFSKELFFDEKFKMVEDYEISLKTIYNSQHTARYNFLTANKPKNGTNKGGLHERYIKGELPFWIKLLQKKYPIFIPNKNLTGGSIRWKK